MRYEVYSYRFAQEIMQHQNHISSWNEIANIINQTPLFIYPNKSNSNRRLDVVQQVMNTYYDRVMAVDNRWEYHPLATSIPDSGLAADYRKTFNGLTIQAEIQFGNMARWYSDIFKFQTAYSQGLINIGLCLIPMNSLATRIDSNVVNFERVRRELPSAELSITIPIIVIGIDTDANTQIVDTSACQFAGIGQITGIGAGDNRYRIVNGYLNSTPMAQISGESETGPIAVGNGYVETEE